MNTFTLTDNEVQMIKCALEMYNDIKNDTMLEEVATVSLYSDHPVTLDPDDLSALREEIDAIIDRAITLRTLMNKFDIKVDTHGYSLP